MLAPTPFPIAPTLAQCVPVNLWINITMNLLLGTVAEIVLVFRSETYVGRQSALRVSRNLSLPFRKLRPRSLDGS